MLTLRELTEQVNEYAEKYHQEPFVTLQESKLPVSHGKSKDEPPELDLHARLTAAMRGERLLGVKPLAEVTELAEDRTERKLTEITLPDGIHQQLIGRAR